VAHAPDPDKIKAPGGLTMRKVHELVRQSAMRDKQSEKTTNPLTQKASRWQRFVRYVWDKRRG
jgi:hypothetical protein